MWGMSGMPTPGNLASMTTRLPQQMPSMIAPTVDIEELDKRIADLRAVAAVARAERRHAAHDDSDARGPARHDCHAQGHHRRHAGADAQSGSDSSAAREPVCAATARNAYLICSHTRGRRATARGAGRNAAAQAQGCAGLDASKLADDALNPAAWWHALQDQFAKIATGATEAPRPRPSPRPRKRSGRSGGRARGPERRPRATVYIT